MSRLCVSLMCLFDVVVLLVTVNFVIAKCFAVGLSVCLLCFVVHYFMLSCFDFMNFICFIRRC